VVLSFTSNPSNVTAALDSEFTMTATATTSQPPISYQWQYSDTPSNEGSWIVIPGQTTDTLTLKATLARDNRWYRNTAETSAKTAKSAPAQLDVTVQPPPPPPPVKTEPVWKDAVIEGTTKRVTGHLFACLPSSPYDEKYGRPESAGIRRPSRLGPLFTATHMSKDGVNWAPFSGKTPESKGFTPPVNQIFWLNDTYMMWSAYPTSFPSTFGWPNDSGLFVSSNGKTWIDSPNISGNPFPDIQTELEDGLTDKSLNFDNVDTGQSYRYTRTIKTWNDPTPYKQVGNTRDACVWSGRTTGWKADVRFNPTGGFGSSLGLPQFWWAQNANGVSTTVSSLYGTSLIVPGGPFFSAFEGGNVGGGPKNVGIDSTHFYVFDTKDFGSQGRFVVLEKKIERPLLPMNPPRYLNLNFPASRGEFYWIGTSSLNDGKYYINENLENTSGWQEMTMPGAAGYYMGQPVDAQTPGGTAKTVIPLYAQRSWEGTYNQAGVDITGTITNPPCIGIKYCE
jgi:hypothetical protein